MHPQAVRVVREWGVGRMQLMLMMPREWRRLLLLPLPLLLLPAAAILLYYYTVFAAPSARL
jgi:hypothetical protein